MSIAIKIKYIYDEETTKQLARWEEALAERKLSLINRNRALGDNDWTIDKILKSDMCIIAIEKIIARIHSLNIPIALDVTETGEKK